MYANRRGWRLRGRNCPPPLPETSLSPGRISLFRAFPWLCMCPCACDRRYSGPAHWPVPGCAFQFGMPCALVVKTYALPVESLLLLKFNVIRDWMNRQIGMRPICWQDRTRVVFCHNQQTDCSCRTVVRALIRAWTESCLRAWRRSYTSVHLWPRSHGTDS